MVYCHNISGPHQFVIACFGQKHPRFEETIQSNNEHADVLEVPQYLNLSIQVAYTYLRLSGRVRIYKLSHPGNKHFSNYGQSIQLRVESTRVKIWYVFLFHRIRNGDWASLLHSLS